ncbi:hypothetical protein GQ457_18G011580 [Hibiscus cannabinus]
MQITNFVEARRQGGSRHNFCSRTILWLWYPEFCISGLEYRYLISGIDTQFQHWNLGLGIARGGIGTPLMIHLVSILGEGYRYPSSSMELEYRYWLPSIDIGCRKIVYGVLRSLILYVLVPELTVCDFMSLNDPFDSKLYT